MHASLLPALRGAAPIQGAVRAGLAETGVTIMRMVQALDAGPIMLQARTPIARDETAGELEARLSELGALALVEALTLMSLGRLTETPQDDSKATYAPKILREMARIDWSESSDAVARHIRAYDPKPGAFTTHRGGEIKLFGATVATRVGARHQRTRHRGDDRLAGDVHRVRQRRGAHHVRAALRPQAHRPGRVDARPRHRCR